MNTVSLDDLIGEHELSGVDFDNAAIATWGEQFEDCQTINFVLDGQTYTATEDPCDGWRSCMRDIVKSEYKVKNTFGPCRVIGTMRENDYLYNYDVLDFVDAKTGLAVLSVGTRDFDDYYPCWVASFSPENMAINAGR